MAANGHEHYSRETEQYNRDLLPVEMGGKAFGFKREPRCRVCNHSPEFLSMVNEMLVNGESYTETFRRAVEYDKRKKPITFASVWTHGQKHMPSKQAAVRRIIEARSEQMNRSFIEGTHTLLDEVIYSETMMRVAFETMTENGAEVSARDGLEAAKFVRQIKASEEDNTSLTGVLSQLSDIIEAVKTTVPEHMWNDIVRKLDDGSTSAISAPSVVVESDDDEVFDPAETDSDRDDLE